MSSQTGLSASPFMLYFHNDHYFRKTHTTLSSCHKGKSGHGESLSKTAEAGNTAQSLGEWLPPICYVIYGVKTPSYRREEHLSADDDLDKRQTPIKCNRQTKSDMMSCQGSIQAVTYTGVE